MQQDATEPEGQIPRSINPWVDKEASPIQRKEALMDMIIGQLPNQQTHYQMKDKVSILKEDKNYASYFRAACKDNMDLMQLIVDQEENYAESL